MGKTTELIFTIVKENPEITREELGVKLDLSMRGIEYNLSKFRENGIIPRVGGRKDGYWQVNRKSNV